MDHLTSLSISLLICGVDTLTPGSEGCEKVVSSELQLAWNLVLQEAVSFIIFKISFL